MSGIIMIKTMMGLGVLSIPAVFDTLGLIPGIICLLAIAAITTWSSVQIQHFKVNHPSIYGVDDAGQMMVGRWGREILYIAFILGGCLPGHLVRIADKLSVDHGRRFWYDQYLHRTQRCFDSWNL
jgi:amino acid permease